MKKTFSILIFVLLCGTASAQTARQVFNPAAREYIHGNTAAASNLVERALIKFPDDEKLLKLKKLIEEQQKQKDQQDQSDSKDQNKDQQKQDQKDQQDQDKQKQDQQNQDQPSQDQQQESSNPRQAGAMSEEEAQQLLDAMKQNEKDQRANLRPYLGQPVRVNKDW